MMLMKHSFRLLPILATAALAPTVLTLTGCETGRPKTISKGLTIDEGKRIRSAIANYELADRAHHNGDSEEAIEYYRRSIEDYSDLHMTWNDLGVELMSVGRYPDAEQAFRQAARIEPSDPRPWYNLGALYQNRFYDAEALECYVNALRRRPNYLPALRGAIQSADLINQVDDTTLGWLREAIVHETDPEWLSKFQRLRLEIESRLASESP